MMNFKQFAGVFVCAILLFGAGNASAAGTSWKAAVTGDWNDANNWTAGVPTPSLWAIDKVGGIAQVSGLAYAPSMDWDLGDIEILAGGSLDLGQHTDWS